MGWVPYDDRKANVTLLFKSKKEDPENNRPVSFTSVPGKMMEKTHLEDTFRHSKDKKVTQRSQHKFGKSTPAQLTQLTGLIPVIHIVDKGKGISVAYLNFTQSFVHICHSLLAARSMRYEIDE